MADFFVSRRFFGVARGLSRFGGPGSGPRNRNGGVGELERDGVRKDAEAGKAYGPYDLDPEAIAQIRGGFDNSATKYKDAAGNYTPERQAIHEKILDNLFAGVKPAVGQPEVLFLGGGPASGKSSYLKLEGAPDPSLYVTLNSDDVKAQLPEWQPLLEAGDHAVAAFTHEESSDVAKMAMQRALAGGYNTIVDGCGDTSVEAMTAKIDDARESGASVRAVYVTIPTETAVDRASSRGVKSGRFIPAEVILHEHASVSQVAPLVAPEFDSFELYDNSGSMKLIASATRGQDVTVVDEPLYNGFLSKGNV